MIELALVLEKRDFDVELDLTFRAFLGRSTVKEFFKT
jgi:hypothetical protein